MKKNLTFSKLLMLVIVAVLPLSMMAQEGKKHAKPAEKYWYIQADGGLSINHGDLANYPGGIWEDFNHYKSIALQNWNAHLGIGYQFGKVIGLNFKGGYGLLSGHKHGITPNSTTLSFMMYKGLTKKMEQRRVACFRISLAGRKIKSGPLGSSQ